MTNDRREYIPREVILAEIQATLARHAAGEIDHISFVGSGEPTLHSGLGWLIRCVKQLTPIPVAVITNGALLYCADVREELLAADIVMPDVKVCGGMLELKKIAALAGGAGLLCSPHGPASPIGNAAAAHVVATIPNFNILEFSYGEVPWRAELVDPPERVEGGALMLSDRPGLGMTLNEKVTAKYAVT